MIVDDYGAMLTVLELILEEAGYSVMAFKSAVDAFDYINTHPKSIDLLVTDYSMPLISRFELAQKLKIIQQDIPVLCITGYEIGYLEASLQPQIIDQEKADACPANSDVCTDSTDFIFPNLSPCPNAYNACPGNSWLIVHRMPGVSVGGISARRIHHMPLLEIPPHCRACLHSVGPDRAIAGASTCICDQSKNR